MPSTSEATAPGTAVAPLPSIECPFTERTLTVTAERGRAMMGGDGRSRDGRRRLAPGGCAALVRQRAHVPGVGTHRAGAHHRGPRDHAAAAVVRLPGGAPADRPAADRARDPHRRRELLG